MQGPKAPGSLVFVFACTCALAASACGSPNGSVSRDAGGTGGRAGGGTSGGAKGPDASTGGSPAGGGPGGSGQGGSGPTGNHPGYYVNSNMLFDRCDERVVLRGIDKMVIYWDTPGRSYPEIAKTGANAVRIMWNGDPTVSASTLAGNLQAAVNNQLIPVLGDWDAIGDWTKMQVIEDWWTSAPIVAVVQQYTPYMIANIANEAGQTVADADWVSTYTRIINHMRQVGIHALLAVDAAGYGRNVEQLLTLAPQLLAADPDHNLIFDWHEYDGGSAQNARITTAFNNSVSMGLCLMVGEFADGGAGDCTADIPFQWLIQEAKRTGVGFFPWSWDNFNSDCEVNNDSIFNMVTDPYDFTTLVPGWPTEVCTTDPNSILNTSIRPHSMTAGSCQ